MKIAIASKNPNKVEAIKQIFEFYFPNSEFASFNIQPSGTNQPIGKDQTIELAIERVNLLKAETKADFYVAIESGFYEDEFGAYSFGVCIISDSQGKISKVSGDVDILPEDLAILIKNGVEMGPAVDEIFGTKNIKQKGGLISILTKNLITREDDNRNLVIKAITPWLAKDLEEVENDLEDDEL